jgi:hypothetical protein
VNAAIKSDAIAFSSMTKDSGLLSTNSDWLTADASAGRLISGTVATPLAAGDVVKVYANGNLLGNATVNSAGTAWAITDPNAYTGSWVYSANVVRASGTSTTAVQPVNLDTSTLAAPVITSVGTDATFATVVAHNGSTGDNTLVVKGTGVPGSFITLYDNTSGFAVKSGVLVNSSGEWTADLTSTPLFNGTHNFFAAQSNAQGVVSPLSNQYTASVLFNLVSNGSFESPVVTAGTFGTTLSGSNLPGWTISSGTVDVMAENFSYGALGVSPTTPWGTQMLDMDGVSAGTIRQDINNLVVGETYAWSFAYARFLSSADQLRFDLTGAATVSTTYTPTSSTLTTVNGTFVATTSSVRMTFTNIQGGGTADAGVALDNIVLSKVDSAAPTVDGSLAAGATVGGATSAANSMNYGGGVLESLAGNDTITATHSALQSALDAGGLIDGGAGVDTLRLASGTTLNLATLGGNQTVKPIQEVEVFEMQGNSSLKLSANDVLSLGGSNASTMSAYSFASTTQLTFGSTVATGTTSSTGKVQFVVNGTSSDVVSLDALGLDNVSTNGTVGNTGLAGQWDYKGTTDIAVGGVTTTYRVYNHSTTAAQVLMDNDIAGNRVTITRAESSAKTYVEEFDNPTYTAAAGFNVRGWTITQVNTATGARTDNLAINQPGFGTNIGSDTLMQVNPSNTQTNPYNRTINFQSKIGPFNAISFVHQDLQGPQGPLPIKFFDEAGNLVNSTTLSTFGQGVTFSYTLPAGVMASSFKIETTLDDLWIMDTLTAGVVNGTALSSGSGSIDTTPLLRGTYEGKLNAGDVIKVYDGATELGNATVDPATMTWSYQVGTAASIGNHTYSAKIVGSGSQQLATSSNFTLNILASPLVLDMNGDGVQTLGIEEGVQFDLLNTGTAQQVGWVDKHDGLLVIDLNQDGVINTGAELFGSSTALTQGGLAEDGWLALAQFDLDTDGRIDAKDAVFKDLQVWVDTNSNGVSEAGELRSLADAGVQSINLQHDNTQITQNGNVLQGFSSFTTTDGQSHQIVDAWLQTTVAAVAPTFNLVNAKEDTLNLNLADVRKTAANTAGLQVVQVNGEATDTVNLSNLLDTGEAQGGWQASGVVVKTGVTYNAFSHSADASLQVLIDQNITQVNMG